MRNILLNPGPVTLSEGVRQATVGKDMCHREPEFFDLQDGVRSKLLDVYQLDSTEWSAVLLGGSGTSALEAMMSSLLPTDGRVLVLENGVYGERLSRLAELAGVKNESIHQGWGEAWNLEEVENGLQSSSFTHVAAVHHETTTGRLNPVDALCELCEKYQVELLLDGVSSFGAEDIPFSSSALTACAATANKCLHGIPGLCFVILRQPAFSRTVNPPRSLTLNLALWADHQDRRSTPFTPPVQALLSLEQALKELQANGGWRSRHTRYTRLATQVLKCLAAQGVAALISPEESSCVLRAYQMPVDRTYQVIHDGLKRRGFIIYAGQGSLEQSAFRISTMGDISDYDMEHLLVALNEVFSD